VTAVNAMQVAACPGGMKCFRTEAAQQPRNHGKNGNSSASMHTTALDPARQDEPPLCAIGLEALQEGLPTKTGGNGDGGLGAMTAVTCKWSRCMSGCITIRKEIPRWMMLNKQANRREGVLFPPTQATMLSFAYSPSPSM